MRKPFTQVVDEAVDRARVRCGSAGVLITVVIPLEKGDRVFGEQRAERFEQVLACRVDREVERVLVAPGGRVGSGVGVLREHPLRMLAREPRLRTHHLGLDPEAELHPAGDDGVGERVETGWPALGIDRPVTEGAAVVGAASEPAVVEHEALDAQLGGSVDERQ